MPRRASPRATFAAEPPARSRTIPGTSVPETVARSGATTTSSMRSPRTTTEIGRPGRRPESGPGSRPPGDRGLRRLRAIAGGYRHGVRPYNAQPGSPAVPRSSPRSFLQGVLDMAIAEKGLERLAIDTIRTLSIDAVQKANSGHPGAPMGAAPMAYVVWTRFLRHAPTQPGWPDRDRFVLSAGHASMLLYSLLHLTGYDLPLDQLKRFRQWGSRTPGHPEYRLTAGVEATTGPLGQGFANGVGVAIAERRLS